MHHLLTPDQARAILDMSGDSIADFARRHSLDEPTVYQVLSGRKKGRRGEAHRAAVLLGIKAGTEPAAINTNAIAQIPLQ
ncbi:MAG: DNA-binding protein [Pseudohongiella sp.]|nr:DNA-binding protein [Pseudohongiella sp.]